MKKASIDPSVQERADAFSAVADRLKTAANRDIVLAEIDKLITIEDQAPTKDKIITELKGQIAVFEVKVRDLMRDNATMTEKIDKQAKTIETQGQEIQSLSTAIQELKGQLQQASDTFNLTGLQLMAKGFMRALVRR